MTHVCREMVDDRNLGGTTEQFTELAVYKCGGCKAMFKTICLLHEHMNSHVPGGSYHYNHTILTAFPKYDYVCNASQTDLDLKVFKRRNCVGFQSDNYENDMHGLNISVSAQNFKNCESKFLNESVEVETGYKGQTDFKTIEDTNASSDETVTGDEVPEVSFVLSTTNGEGIVKWNKKYEKPFETIDDSETVTEIGEKSALGSAGDNKINDNQTDQSNVCEKIEQRKSYSDRDWPIRKHAARKRFDSQRKSLENNLHVDYSVNDTCFSVCHICGKLLRSSATLKRHMAVVHPEERTANAVASLISLMCPYCGIISMSRMELQNHFKEKHSKSSKNFPCQYCEMEFSTAISKSQHVSNEHPEINDVLKKFHKSKNSDVQTNCKICGKLFTSAAGLALHVSSVHLKKKFKCDICNVELSHKFTLKAHKIEKHHENMRGFDCTICKKTFAYKFRLKAHMEHVHPSPDKIQTEYICETCGYFAKSKASLRYHSAKHDLQRKQYQCEECPYKTFYKSSMTEHTASHQGDRRFVCDVCGDRFFTSKQLKVHMRRHTGEMPYQCGVCNKRFRTDIAYSRHRDIHLNKMRFKCEFCDKEFVQKTNCTAHMRQHTGEKPYKCDWCEQSFTHNVSRKNHMTKCDKKANE